ncbi:type II secretion system F family protein [Pelovirga terrestris]|uniref:Type II secretion system F family protein n=1 Tax=Pelovirga terrestris TaxID=2771352 RepID=A0A8J6UQ27_9BACT|nr:type II secretion system F family protein [Pelovirga terrestris]MBD1401414.1 type II secretion system F family protein [Pelovirga terrestris]
MPLYRYKIRDAQGNNHQGESEASSAEGLASLFQAQQAIPIDIVEIPAKTSLSLEKIFRFRLDAGVTLDDLNLYCRQMYTLINAGVPLIKALRGLVATSRNPSLGKALNLVVEDLESGMELSGCYSRHPKVFPPLLCHMVQVGEVTGKLDQVFVQLAVYFEREKETINRVKSALRYPTFVIVAILFAVIFVSLFVIPAFEKVFAGAGSNLPLATRILMGLSAFMQNYWHLLLVALVLVVFVVRRALKTTKGRYLWDQYKLRLPLVGSIILRATLARFSRGFNMSYTAGVPLSQALGLTARAVNNTYVGGKIEMIRNGIERGETLTRSATKTGMFTPLVLQMLAVGEESGSVDTMLEDVAEFYEREVDYDLKNLSSAIEPIMIVIIGVMVLVLALGVFLPMWNLASIAR